MSISYPKTEDHYRYNIYSLHPQEYFLYNKDLHQLTKHEYLPETPNTYRYEAYNLDRGKIVVFDTDVVVLKVKVEINVKFQD